MKKPNQSNKPDKPNSFIAPQPPVRSISLTDGAIFKKVSPYKKKMRTYSRLRGEKPPVQTGVHFQKLRQRSRDENAVTQRENGRVERIQTEQPDKGFFTRVTQKGIFIQKVGCKGLQLDESVALKMGFVERDGDKLVVVS